MRDRSTCYLVGVLDLLLQNARVLGEPAPRDLGVRGELFAAPEAGEGARQTIDLGGALVTAPLVEPHIHLDAVLTAGQPRHNESGSLFEGIAIWGERVAGLTVDEVKERVRTVLRWELSCGVQHVRGHVDVCNPRLTALRALVELREEVGDQIEVQLVAFPQQGIFSFEGGEELMRRAVAMGADVVGAIPHFELTRDLGVRSVEFAFDLADEHGLMVDLHCDETDDDQARFTEVMAAETIRRRMGGRVTASHTTAMHSYNGAYAGRLITNIARSGMHMVTNPLDNSALQGRFDNYPIRRGHTRIKELQAAGVTVAIGHDSVMDPWYPLGIGDPLQAAFVLVHFGQMTGRSEIARLFHMITSDPARVLALDGYGLREGGPASLVAFGVPDEFDAVRLVPRRQLVLRRGRVVARAETHQTVVWDGVEEEVTYLP